MVLAGEALGGQIAERRSTAVAAVGVVVLVATRHYHCHLINDDSRTVEIVAPAVDAGHTALVGAVVVATTGRTNLDR